MMDINRKDIPKYIPTLFYLPNLEASQSGTSVLITRFWKRVEANYRL